MAVSSSLMSAAYLLGGATIGGLVDGATKLVISKETSGASSMPMAFVESVVEGAVAVLVVDFILSRSGANAQEAGLFTIGAVHNLTSITAYGQMLSFGILGKL